MSLDTANVLHKKIAAIAKVNNEIIERLLAPETCIIKYNFTAQHTYDGFQFEIKQQTQSLKEFLTDWKPSRQFTEVDDLFNLQLNWKSSTFEQLVQLHNQMETACSMYTEHPQSREHLLLFLSNFEVMQTIFGEIEERTIDNQEEFEEVERCTAEMQETMNKVFTHRKIIADGAWFNFPQTTLLLSRFNMYECCLSYWTGTNWTLAYKELERPVFSMLEKVKSRNPGPIIFVFQTEECHLFGGCISNDASNNAIFLFTFKNPHKRFPTKFEVCKSISEPGVGFGNDLLLYAGEKDVLQCRCAQYLDSFHDPEQTPYVFTGTSESCITQFEAFVPNSKDFVSTFLSKQ